MLEAEETLSMEAEETLGEESSQVTTARKRPHPSSSTQPTPSRTLKQQPRPRPSPNPSTPVRPTSAQHVATQREDGNSRELAPSSRERQPPKPSRAAAVRLDAAAGIESHSTPPPSLEEFARRLEAIDAVSDDDKVAEIRKMGLLPLTNMVRTIEERALELSKNEGRKSFHIQHLYENFAAVAPWAPELPENPRFSRTPYVPGAPRSERETPVSVVKALSAKTIPFDWKAASAGATTEPPAAASPDDGGASRDSMAAGPQPIQTAPEQRAAYALQPSPAGGSVSIRAVDPLAPSAAEPPGIVGEAPPSTSDVTYSTV